MFSKCSFLPCLPSKETPNKTTVPVAQGWSLLHTSSTCMFIFLNVKWWSSSFLSAASITTLGNDVQTQITDIPVITKKSQFFGKLGLSGKLWALIKAFLPQTFHNFLFALYFNLINALEQDGSVFYPYPSLWKVTRPLRNAIMLVCKTSIAYWIHVVCTLTWQFRAQQMQKYKLLKLRKEVSHLLVLQKLCLQGYHKEGCVRNLCTWNAYGSSRREHR